MAARPQRDSKTKLLDAAMHVIRQKGYEAASVDDICAAAGLSKGSFFHHFDTKQALALAAADHFAAMADSHFAAAAYHAKADPLDRLLGYVDLRAAMMRGELPDFTCLLGTMAQEVYETHPAISNACGRHISEHAATLAKDISEAKRRYAPRARFNADSLAMFTQATIQGAFVLAKARHDPAVATDCMSHLRRYLETLFTEP